MSELSELLEYTIAELGDNSLPKYVLPDDPVEKAIMMMRDNGIGSCLVIDENVNLKGIITERDVLYKVVLEGMLTDPVSKYMTEDPQTIKSNESVVIGLSMMTRGNFRHLPVVNLEGKATGLVSIRDIMGFFTNHLRDD